MSLKKERIESLIKREVALTITNKLSDPALKFCSVTDVMLTDDLSFATVYVSFLDDSHKEPGINVLVKAKGLLRTAVSKAIGTRRTPEILIKLDESSERGARIDSILNEIK